MCKGKSDVGRPTIPVLDTSSIIFSTTVNSCYQGHSHKTPKFSGAVTHLWRIYFKKWVRPEWNKRTKAAGSIQKEHHNRQR